METGELGTALRAWRDRLSPAAAGLPTGNTRRAPGLRREELSQLAGLSVDYVTRLEQGRASNPSAQVLGSIARALRLSTPERDHLFHLAGQAAPAQGQVSRHLTPGVQRMVDRLSETPVAVFDAAWSLVTWNCVWAALHGDPSGWTGRELNLVWRTFVLGQPSPFLHHEQEPGAFERSLVADLRRASVAHPTDDGLRGLITELRAGSAEFAALWDQHVVDVYRSSRKSTVHPLVGPITLDCDVLSVSGSDLRVVCMTAEPGSADAEALELLHVIGLQQLDSTPTA